jgi:hypothetical protein
VNCIHQCTFVSYCQTTRPPDEVRTVFRQHEFRVPNVAPRGELGPPRGPFHPFVHPAVSTLYCLEERSAEQRVFTPRGQSSLFRANLTPRGNILPQEAKLKTGL